MRKKVQTFFKRHGSRFFFASLCVFCNCLLSEVVLRLLSVVVLRLLSVVEISRYFLSPGNPIHPGTAPSITLNFQSFSCRRLLFSRDKYFRHSKYSRHFRHSKYFRHFLSKSNYFTLSQTIANYPQLSTYGYLKPL